jgi:hypothetical protein
VLTPGSFILGSLDDVIAFTVRADYFTPVQFAPPIVRVQESDYSAWKASYYTIGLLLVAQDSDFIQVSEGLGKPVDS